MQEIGINDLIEGKGPIWLINTSSNKYPGGAEVYITMAQGDQSSVFVMPRTWLPSEVTKRYPRKSVCESPYFMEALSNGLISVISADAAAKLLIGAKADRERSRLKAHEEAIKAANSTRGINKNVMISTGDPDRDEELAAQDKKLEKGNAFIERKVAFDDADEPEPTNVEAGFQAWVIKLNQMDDVDEVKNELRLRGEMSIEEAIWLMKNCIHEPVSERIRKRLVKLGELDAGA